MRFENQDFFGVVELCERSGGLRFQRIGEKTRLELNERAQEKMLEPENCEIRFMAKGQVRVVLSSEETCDFRLFHGPFDASRLFQVGKEKREFLIEYSRYLEELPDSHFSNCAYNPRVFRLIFGGVRRSPVIFHEMEGEGLRAPDPEFVPGKSLLVYGSSITQGHKASGPHLNYGFMTAQEIGYNFINLGSAGSCHIEAEIADEISERRDWDIGVFELSANMVKYPMALFKERARYFVERIASTDPNRKIVCISLFPCSGDYDLSMEVWRENGLPWEFRHVLEDIVQDLGMPNLRCMHGPELLSGITGLSADMTHPCDAGMVEISRKLTRFIQDQGWDN